MRGAWPSGGRRHGRGSAPVRKGEDRGRQRVQKRRRAAGDRVPGGAPLLGRRTPLPLREGGGACGEARAALRQHPHPAQRHPSRPRRWSRRRRLQRGMPLSATGIKARGRVPAQVAQTGAGHWAMAGQGRSAPSPPRGMPWRRGRAGVRPALIAPKRPLLFGSNLFEKDIEGVFYPLTAVGPSGEIRGLPPPSPLPFSQRRGSTGP